MILATGFLPATTLNLIVGSAEPAGEKRTRVKFLLSTKGRFTATRKRSDA